EAPKFMPTKLIVYTNEDDALLFWRINAPITGCRGFAIERRITRQGEQQPKQEFLPNRMGFENEKVAATPKEGQPAVLKSSTEWPFQRFSWTDHDANTGDAVSYRVIPMIRKTGGALERADAEASAWSPARVLGATAGATFQPFFNRGFVMSQFMARYLQERKLSLQQFK